MASIISATTTNGLVTSADNSGSLQLATNSGTTAVTITTGQNVGVGVTPTARLHVYGGGNNQFKVESSGAEANFTIAGTSYGQINNAVGDWYLTNDASANMIFRTASTERMRIDSSGNVVLQARTTGTGQLQVGNSAGTMPNGYAVFTGNSDSPYPIVVKGLSGSQGMIGFFDTSNNVIGSVAKASSSVQYLTSSDYRLKNDVVPMAGALGKVSQLKPVTYKWKSDDSNGQGFIAHELAEVFPDAVSGEKDAVDADGNIKPQGIDTSFLVATLTAAIQELNAKVDAQAAEIQALKGVA